ncbi:MAG: hypothetical protein ACETWR_22675, partial [Anaerolineae bacterium]
MTTDSRQLTGRPKASPGHPHYAVESEVRGLVLHDWPIGLVGSVVFQNDGQINWRPTFLAHTEFIG